MLFRYPSVPHVRKHGPGGYTDYTSYKDWLRDEFSFQCVYCLEREAWYPSRQAAFGVDHVLPQGVPRFAPLVCVYENLVYACNRCNAAKRDELLPDPCAVALGECLRVGDDGVATGLTPEGVDMIRVLDLDGPARRAVRRYYGKLLSLYAKHPDDPEVGSLYFQAFGYPDDLPDLSALRPGSNSRPTGLRQTFAKQRHSGVLPAVYF